MAVPVLVRFSRKQVEAIDLLIAEGVAGTRPEVIYRAVETLDEAICWFRAKLEFDESRRQQPRYEPEERRATAVQIALSSSSRWVWTEDGRCVPEQEAQDQCAAVVQCPPRPDVARVDASPRIRLIFGDEQLEAIDRLVANDVGVTRPEAIRRAVESLDRVVCRSRGYEEFYRHQPEVEQEGWVWTEDGKVVPERVAIEEGIPIADGPPRQRAAIASEQ